MPDTLTELAATIASRRDADPATSYVARLIAGGAPSLHFYTLNLAKPTQAVLARM